MKHHNLLKIITLTLASFALAHLVHAEEEPCPALIKTVFISEARLRTLKSRVEHKAEPTWSAWLILKKSAESALDREPHAPTEWFVPFFYEDPDGHTKAKEGLQDDANAAYSLALVYRMTDDERYAQVAARLINAWGAEVKNLKREEDSCLSFSYHFPALIIAASLLKDSESWPTGEQEAFRRFVREKALPLNTMSRKNNWGNWGLVLVLACAAYTDDPSLLERGATRWKEFTESQVAADGHLIHEVNRGGFGRKGDSGLWYSNFSLLPQTIAAEILRVNGVDIYEYESPSGRSLRQAFEWLAPWIREPERFPYFQGGDGKQPGGAGYVSYFEILNAHWPHSDAMAVLERLRPLSARHSTPWLTFTHGDLLNDARE